MDAHVTFVFPMFHAESWHVLPARPGSKVAIVALDRTVEDFAHVIGQEVVIDGRLYACVGVERFAHSPPWWAGERIGLLVWEEP